MADEHEGKEIVIIKRRGSRHGDGHHGGAWKIAYADFMTAMMAFFLVLWLVNSSSKEAKDSIARYFNPIKLVDSTVSKKGLDSNKEVEVQKAGKTEDAKHAEAKEAAPAKSEAKPPPGKSAPPAIGDPLGEQGLFANPEAALSEIAARPEPVPDTGPESKGSRGGQGTAAAGEAYRDPFKPLTRRASPGPVLDAEDRMKPAPVFRDEMREAATPEPKPVEPAASPKDIRPPAMKGDLERGGDQRQVEALRLQDDLTKRLASEIGSGAAPKLDIKATPEGLLISLTDDADYGMFGVGSAQPQPKVVRMMQQIGELLKSRPGSIIIRGHTDARPFKGGGYDNWRLSSDRAQIVRFMLLRGGLTDARIEHVEGWADRRLRVTARPEAAENRRIEILIRNQQP